MSLIRIVIDMPGQYAGRLPGESDRDYVTRIVDDSNLWDAVTVTVPGEQEDEAQWLLENLADRNMSEGNEYGGSSGLLGDYAPAVFAGIGKELVVEFCGTLHDGTRVTTTRPLAYKDADGNIAPRGVPYRAQKEGGQP